MQGEIPAVLIYEDLEHLTPYMHTADDVVGVSLNSPALLEANARLAAASVMTLAGYPSSAHGAAFVRGDSNADGTVDLSDALWTLGHLFLGEPETLGCAKAADTDGSGLVDISDAVALLGHLFLGRAAPPGPFPECGTETSPTSPLCDIFPPCR